MHTDIPALTRRSNQLAWRLLRHQQAEGTPSSHKTFARLALRYYVGRWDLIPDFVPGIGLLDDFLFLKLAVALLEPPEAAIPEALSPGAVQEEIARTLKATAS